MAESDGISRPLALVPRDPELDFYRRRVAGMNGPILVLGCANGRLAAALAHELEVVAVDPSATMIEAAEAARADEPAEVQARLRYLRGDLRALRLGERFALVLAPQNALGSLGGLGDLEAGLATARHHLAEGGTLLYELRQLPPQPARTIEEPGMPAFLEPPRPAFTPHLREARNGPIRRLRTRPFTAEELTAAFTRAGLTELELYGDFAGKPLDAVETRRIGVAMRAGAETLRP